MARPVRTYYTFVDNKGDSSRVVVYLPATTSFEDVVQFVNDMCDVLAPLTGAALREAGFNGIVRTGDLPAEPGSDVQEKAEFAFETSEYFTSRLTIPAILEELFVPGTEDLDRSDADVSAFSGAMLSGLTVNGHQVYPCDSRGDDLVSLETAREAWSHSQKDKE